MVPLASLFNVNPHRLRVGPGITEKSGAIGDDPGCGRPEAEADTELLVTSQQARVGKPQLHPLSDEQSS